MTSRLYTQKRGPLGGTDIDLTAFTGRKGSPFFDGQDSLIEIGHRFEMGEATQGEFVLMDPDAEMPRADYEYEISPHVLTTWTEDASGNEIWLARTRIASYDGMRGIAKIDNEVEFSVVVEDCNVELRGQAFSEAWVRPEETDVQRLIALQAYTLNGASSTAPHFRETCDVTVNTSHLCPNSNTVTMPAKKYLPGTQPQEVVEDCSQMAGKMYGVVIHHTGGSHLCLLYIVNADHTTYLSPCKISDHIDEWDPLDPSAPVFEPHWEKGEAATTDFQTNLSGFVTVWGDGEQATYVEYATNIEIYDYWVEKYNDSVSTTASQSANRAAGMLEERRQPRLTHHPSVIVQGDQTHLLAAGMSIQIKAAATLGGVFLDTWQTRRICELRWEPRHDGTYWAHMEMDRPVLRVAPGRGKVGPIPPVQSEPDPGATIDYLWEFTDDNFDVTDTYPGGPRWQAGSGGNIYSGAIDPAVGTQSSSPHPTLTAGDYHIRAEVGTDPSNGTVDFELRKEDSTLLFSASFASTGTWVEGDFTMPATDSIYFRIQDHLSAIGTVEISHGGGGASFVGQESSLQPATGITGTVGTSPYYAPLDHEHPVQVAGNTPITDDGGYFIGANVEDALQELGAGLGAGAGLFNVQNYGAVGDDTTDDTSAINDAIADLVAAGEGILYFPPGSYKVTSTLTALSVPFVVRGAGSASFDQAHYISRVRYTSGSTDLFDATARIGRFEHIAMLCDSGGTPSAGTAVHASSAYLEQKTDFEDVNVRGFYDGLDIEVGAQWVMHNVFVSAPVRYGIRIRNTVNNDAGDWSIADSNIYSEAYNATSGIRIESSGGGKIVNTKVNMGLDSKRFATGIDLSVAVTTVVLEIVNCSIENFTTYGFRAASTAGSWRAISITGCEFGPWGDADAVPISMDAGTIGQLAYITIDNIRALNSVASSARVVELTDIDHATIGAIEQLNFVGKLLTTSCTNITDNTGGSVSDHGALTGLGDDDHPQYAMDTDIANAVGPILISDTPAGSPLVFADLLQNEAGDDLLYEEL